MKSWGNMPSWFKHKKRRHPSPEKFWNAVASRKPYTGKRLMDNITVEAVRTTIEHGGFELEVFQLCDKSLWDEYGQYRLSQSQVLERVDEPSNWISRLQKSTPKQLEALKLLGFRGYSLTLKVKGEAKARRAKSLSIDDASAIWGFKASQGSHKALMLLIASTHETIERRADAKFNQARTEEEYEQRTKERILDIPETWTLMFELRFEKNLERITGLHKKDIRNASYYWEFIYHWLTKEERIKLDIINPVQPNGRRKHKIHTCLEQETKDRLRGHIQAILILMESANSVSELRRLLQRREGFDQGDLFDGWGAA